MAGSVGAGVGEIEGLEDGDWRIEIGDCCQSPTLNLKSLFFMDINFFDDPLQSPKSREDVRIEKIGLFIYEDRRRVMFGVELTPFLERPSLQVTITNADGIRAGSLNVIDTLQPNFSLTMHLRDAEVTDPYALTVVVYYATPDSERVDVHEVTVEFETAVSGELIFEGLC